MPGAHDIELCWNEYEQRKNEENADPTIFSPDEPWELNYLIRGIRKQLTTYTETAVFVSIRKATRNLPAPRKRDAFVNFVIEDLLQRQPCAN